MTLLIVTALLMTLPFWAGFSSFVMDTMILAGIFTIVAVGLNLLFGYAGQISLGHAAFVGIGAYTVAIICTKLSSFPTLLALLIGAAVAGAIGLVIAIPVLRLKGHYLALATLALGLIFLEIVKTQNSISLESQGGIGGIPNLNVLGWKVQPKILSSTGYYYVIWIVALLVILFTVNMIRSRVGRGLRALHSSEIAADAMGVDTRKYKIKVFVMSAMLAGLAGGLWALSSGRVDSSMFDLRYSILFVTIVVIGGMGSIWGGLVGAVVLTFVDKILELRLTQWIPIKSPIFADSGNFSVVLYGLLLILFILFLPKGISNDLSRLWSYIKNVGARMVERRRAARSGGK
jgi:branched-chain amino acid transport system permease protein